jgi:exopolyphosphatase / guanosine-5'-triphosphate,3'-diphosphate pyrophosphatase
VTADVRIAALDLGSNSFHLLVVEARADGTFDVLAREKVMLRLGDAVARRGLLGADLVARAVEAVRRLAVLARSAGAAEIIAVGTAALRDATDTAELIERAQAGCGIRVDVIDGLREAELVFRAVQASVLIDPGPALALDLGGGSLELMVGDRAALVWATSVPLGVGWLTELAGDGPVKRVESHVRSTIEEMLAPHWSEIDALAPQMLIGSSGTLRALARTAARIPDGAVLNQLSVGRSELESLRERLCESDVEERLHIPGLDTRRVDQLPVGSVLLSAVMQRCKVSALTVSDWALREGIVLEAIEAAGLPGPGPAPRAVRRHSVVSLCRRCGWNEEHARQVAELAVSLFDQTLPLHGLAAEDRELLELASLLHDIGEHVALEGHERHSAYLIRHGDLRGFSPEEVNLLASVGRFHRRGEPKESFTCYRVLGADWRERTRRLVALLRVADALDRAHVGSVGSLRVEIMSDRVRLTVSPLRSLEPELWALSQKRDLFEATLSRPLEVVAPLPIAVAG